MGAQKDISKPFLLTVCFLGLLLCLPALSPAADATLSWPSLAHNQSTLTLSLSSGRISNFNIGIKKIKIHSYEGRYEESALIRAAAGTTAPTDSPNQTQQNTWFQKWKLTAMLKEFVGSLTSNYGLILNPDSEDKAQSSRIFGELTDLNKTEQRAKLELIYAIKIN